MPKWMTACFALFLSLSVFSTRGQSVDDVINHYIKAMGGRDKLYSMHSLYMEGLLMLPNKTQLRSRVYKVHDKLYREEISSGTGDWVRVITDKEGWSSDPGNAGTLDPLPKDLVRLQQNELHCMVPLVDYAARGHRAKLVGREEVEGVRSYKLQLTLRTGENIYYFIDPSTWYIIREVRKGITSMASASAGAKQEVVQIDYCDYGKADDGYIFARRIKSGTLETRAEYTHIVVNKPLTVQLNALTR